MALVPKYLPDPRPWIRIASAFLLAIGIAACGTEDHYTDPVPPEGSRDSLHLKEGFRAQLIASEPLVEDPVSIAYDKNGRIYVAEMKDYPYPPDPPEDHLFHDIAPETPRSRIRLLEDTDGDGVVDTSTVFADPVSEVSSVLPYDGGVLATSAPNILFLKDTTGNRKADVRKVLFTGFNVSGNSEGQIAGLRWGPDNWIYVSNNGRDGIIGSPLYPDADSVDVDGHDFRFRLDTGEFEAAAGPAQWGHDFNRYGHRFVTHNTIHVRHVVIPHRYLARNDHLPSHASREDINDHGLRMYQLTDAPYWRKIRSQRRNKRYQEEGIDRKEYISGHFSGASGGRVYEGNTFPSRYYGNLFTSEVLGNLVHQDVLRPQGPTYVASRAEDEQTQEFLASTDPWFTPVNSYVGPRGDLIVIDMYRKFIEGPEFVPEDFRENMDFLAGTTMGRLYRITPDTSTAPHPQPNLGSAPSSRLVQLLGHPNEWWRNTAHRLLFERNDQTVEPELRRLGRTADRPETRIRALYVLDALEALTQADVRHRLDDPSSEVQEHAITLAENFPGLLSELTGKTDAAEGRVALQLALSLGEFSGRNARNGLIELAARYPENRWYRIAIQSSEIGSNAAFLEALAADGRFFTTVTDGRQTFISWLGENIGSRGDSDAISRTLSVVQSGQLRNTAWQTSLLDGLHDGLPDDAGITLSPAGQEALDQLRSQEADTVARMAERISDRLASDD